MRILKLRGRNVNSLKGEFMVDFTLPPLVDSGIFAITGPTGSGKTTLLDTICLAMYNTVPRRSNPREDVMTKHAVDCLAEVEFAVGEKVYRTCWTQKRSYGKADGKLQQPRMELSLEKDGIFEIEETHIAKVLNRIEEITGLDFARFGQSIMLAQGSFMAFLTADDNSRANLLEKMTGTEIYAEISMLAYKKAISEEEKLAGLEKELKSFEIFTPEQLEDKKAELDSDHKILQGQELKISELKKDIAKFEEYEKDNSRFKQLQKDKEKVSQDLANLKNDFSRLKVYEDNEDVRQLVTEKLRMKREYEDSCKELNEMKVRGEVVAKKLKELDSDRAKNEVQLNDFKEFYSSRISVIEQAKLKDSLIQKEADKKANAEISLNALRQEKQLAETASNVIKNELGSLNENKALVEHELKKLDVVENAGEKLPLLDELLNQLRTEVEDSRKDEAELAEIDRLIIAGVEKDKEFAGNTEKEAERLSILQGKFEKAKANLAELLGDEDEKGLSERISSLESCKTFFEKLLELQTKIAESKFSIIEVQKNILSIESSSQQLFSHKEKHEAEQFRLQEKMGEIEKRLRLEHKYVALESERKNLVDGQPCILCGSTVHPYSEKSQVNISETEKELGVESELLNKVREQLMKAVAEISGANGKLESEKKALAKLEKENGKIADAISALIDKSPLEREVIGDEAEAELRKINAEHNEKKKLLKKSSEVSQELIESERSIHELTKRIAEQNSQHDKLKFELKESKNSLQKLKLKIGQREKLLKTVKNRAADIFKDFGVACETTDLHEEFAELKDLVKMFSEKKNGLSKFEKDIEAAVLRHKNHQLILVELQSKFNEAEKSLAIVAQEISLLRSERQELLGAMTTEVALNELQAQKQEIEQKSQKIAEAKNTCESDLKSINDQQEKLEKFHEKFDLDFKRVSAELTDKIICLGFPSEEEFIAYLPPQDKIEELKNSRNSLTNSLSQIDARMDEAGRKLNELKNFADFDIVSQRSSLNELEKIAEELRLKIAAVKHSINEDQKSREKLGEKGSQIAAQRKERERWARLRSLIGSSEGDKFRKFAQGLTLEILVSLANKKLRLFNNRYQLCRKSANEMSLEIVDTYQADVKRPVNTLSGGESFLVSLALALGLSELASKRIKIESLFLDEGFGTLDSDTLDTALAALNQLQSEGRTIGIISHVESLKERVPVQIQIAPTSGGHSLVAVVG